jgi:hypothetical protein
MTWKDFGDGPEELVIDGICSTIFLYWLVGWPVFAISVVSGILWRLGGVKGGNKLFRRVGVPLVVCGATFLTFHNWLIFLAGPFMVWLAPSYGEKSWLYKRLKNDFLVRGICFLWYWTAFSMAFILSRI